MVPPGCDLVHLLGRALHKLDLSKEPRAGLGVHLGALDSGSLDPRVPTCWPAREFMKPGQPSLRGTLGSFPALCLQPGSCLSLLAAAPSLGLMRGQITTVYQRRAEGREPEGERPAPA